jgi:hypothetical protein
MVPLFSNNKSRSKAKSVPCGPNGEESTPTTTQVQSAASAETDAARRAHSYDYGSPSRLCERDAPADQRTCIFLLRNMAFHSFFVVRFDRPILRSWIGFGRSIVRGRSVSGLLWRINSLYPSLRRLPPLPSPALHRDTRVSVLVA